MFSQDNLQGLKAASGDWLHSLKFLIMVIGVVVGPLMLFVIGGRLLLLISIGLGIRMFGRVARDLSISPKYF